MAMDIGQYHDFLSRLVTESANLAEGLLTIPANEMIASIDNRITQEGRDTNNEKIGDYSTKKSWATIEDFDNQANFKPEQRKDGTGLRRSITLEEGYMELRRIQGYRVDRVVLERTGAGIKNIKQSYSDGTTEIGFTDAQESVKFRGYEEFHDKSVLAPTTEEIAAVGAAQVREIKIFMTKAFQP